jgi:7-carboxy-7-deazaguanine synthase
MEELLSLPVAETFESPQGEGVHAGRLMQFIRLAGCSVGKPFANKEEANKLHQLHDYQEKCTTYDGRNFCCDTNYKMSKRMSTRQVGDLTKDNNLDTICLTGGEPLMHKNIAAFLAELHFTENIPYVHIETSGTIPISVTTSIRQSAYLWFAVAPKMGYLDEWSSYANEIKLLVDEAFDWNKVPDSIKRVTHKVFLQPINYEHSINYKNLDLCLRLQRQHTDLRISAQIHKSWGVR